MPRASRPQMPGYGLAEDGELLPWSWAAERLARARNYFLSTVRPDGRPHVMPIWGLWLDDAFLFSTGETSRKAKNLAANPSCVVCPENGEEAIIVEGVAATMPDELRPRFNQAYFDKYSWDVSEQKQPIWIVRPRVVYGQIEKTFPQTATRWQFD